MKKASWHSFWHLINLSPGQNQIKCTWANFFLPFNINSIDKGNEEVLTFCCQRSGRTSARLLEALGGEDWKITFKRVALATIGGNFNGWRHGSAILMTRTAMSVVWA